MLENLRYNIFLMDTDANPSTAPAIIPITAPVDIVPDDGYRPENYKETDVFAWANNLVQYKDELKVELFFISKNYVLYKTSLAEGLKKQLEPIFIDEMLEFILEGIDKGLIVRGFEQAEAEELVLQRTQVHRVEKLRET